jgi:hypothetical protein
MSTEIVLINPAVCTPRQLRRRQVWQECRTFPLVTYGFFHAGPSEYVLHALTRSLPGFVSGDERGEWTGNVTPGDELSPISAVLAAYDRTVAYDKGTGSLMTDVTAKSGQKTNNQRKPRKSCDEHIALQLCYRQIGISAVAAAARYQSGAKNPAYAPPAIELDERGAAIA